MTRPLQCLWSRTNQINKDDEEEENQVKIVEFNTEEWKVVSAIDVT